jgi:hypothetical protein
MSIPNIRMFFTVSMILSVVLSLAFWIIFLKSWISLLFLGSTLMAVFFLIPSLSNKKHANPISRGGSYKNDSSMCRSASKYFHLWLSERHDDIGFRLALIPDDK